VKQILAEKEREVSSLKEEVSQLEARVLELLKQSAPPVNQDNPDLSNSPSDQKVEPSITEFRIYPESEACTCGAETLDVQLPGLKIHLQSMFWALYVGRWSESSKYTLKSKKDEVFLINSFNKVDVGKCGSHFHLYPLCFHS
jgi:hypothetical protein